MNRRNFIIRGAYTAGGYALLSMPAKALNILSLSKNSNNNSLSDFYSDSFKEPNDAYRPYVRWWWNGNKVEAKELIRELHLLKDAGIGGVEINPVAFQRNTDDLGIPSVEWLSNEWIDLLKVTFDEAKKIGITCDLIVGSGWPFGGEWLDMEDRGQIMVIAVQKIKGPTRFETSLFNILREADPALSEPCSARVPHLVDLRLSPDPLDDLQKVRDLSSETGKERIFIDVPKGDHALYALVRIDSFGGVINGAPGATGPALNHLDRSSVEKYLNHMSDAIQNRIGPLAGNIRSLFTDSMELEGANWCRDMAEHFKSRNGYDIMPYLPFVMYKTGGMGAVEGYDYGVKLSDELKEMTQRMYYDMCVTKAEMFCDRFCQAFVDWCHKLKVKARAQAYGQGFFPLDSSLLYDIPEGESWTTNWLQHRIGEEMSNEDYRRGRAYTMINKYVSSAGHLSGKRLISAEEMTNTYRVFNMTLEFLKIGCDMNAIAGITHSVFHGFNYSPLEAPFPGWLRYGAFYNERNNWWPYFKYFNAYRTRVSGMLINADMYADIAILPPVADMWTTMGMQNEPFPATINVPYQTFLWEAMHKTGNGTDYVSEPVIQNATVRKGWLCYGKRRYNSLFLIEVERMNPETLAKLYEFVTSGGRVFCIEKYPQWSLGWHNHKERDRQVEDWVSKLKKIPDRFILLRKPEDNDFVRWYPSVQKEYNLKPFVTINKPNPYFMVNRYIRDDGSEFFFFVNSHMHNSHETIITFPKEITNKRFAWIWDAVDGKRYRIKLAADGSFNLYLGPADSRIIVFDNETSEGEEWKLLPLTGADSRTLESWDVEFRHSLEDKTEKTHFHVLEDLKNTQFIDFTGTVVYQTKVHIEKPQDSILNLGKTWSVSIVKVNGHDCGISWFGNRLHRIPADYMKSGENEIEVQVVTTMGNYLQTQPENKASLHWVARPGRAPQPKHSMGMVGPVTLYKL
jgi:hypothetical protein